jgi:hypothetical protein
MRGGLGPGAARLHNAQGRVKAAGCGERLPAKECHCTKLKIDSRPPAVQQPTKFVLVINLAKALGLTVQSLLARADEVRVRSVAAPVVGWGRPRVTPSRSGRSRAPRPSSHHGNSPMTGRRRWRTTSIHIRHKLALAFEDLGEQRVRNIARPIRAFQLRLNDGTEFPEGAEDGAPEPPQADEVEIEFWDSIKLSANPLESTRRCHPARRGLRDGPYIDAILENTPVLHHHVADIKADAELHAAVLRRGSVGLGQRILYLHGRVRGVEHAGELSEHAVAGGSSDAPSVPGDYLIDNAAVN